MELLMINKISPRTLFAFAGQKPYGLEAKEGVTHSITRRANFKNHTK